MYKGVERCTQVYAIDVCRAPAFGPWQTLTQNIFMLKKVISRNCFTHKHDWYLLTSIPNC